MVILREFFHAFVFIQSSAQNHIRKIRAKLRKKTETSGVLNLFYFYSEVFNITISLFLIHVNQKLTRKNGLIIMPSLNTEF